ncbi:MAG TPA: argininosuccinate synthase [Chitinophagales bacterium]|nr:argininosuccinate synthase [Chitinophagales bacterium]HMW13587.1 argininosuccinate synthase [Chitinophagales bacterium]HMX59604.1 argininosuccinate synthase [Chitinophagales bacterium]HMY22621.1 argininosuccinate synthase [Chitinophagales bacterium]HMZ33065.1 argininosuccinate synthase [Chitinophagales bacterium]
MKDKVVLAYSGGLDTSYCVKYLTEEKNLDVYAITVNTGGFNAAQLSAIETRAKELGVKEIVIRDVVKEYYEQCIKYLIFGNVLKNNTYPLSVSAERVFQAIAVAEYAKEIGAAYIAHGSTGAGNDQVRFDMVFNIVMPEAKIITPIRDNKLSREEEIAYLKKYGVEIDAKKATYSINQGIWGTSVGGKETLTSRYTLPEEAYPTPLKKDCEPKEISITFEQGEITALNDKKYEHATDVIIALNEIASAYAIGRDIHVGDTIIGIKGRVGFEAAAPLIIIKAHHLLEKHTLTKQQLFWKDQLSNVYGSNLHEGLFYEPLMRDLEAFMTNTQANVTGKVFIKLQAYRFELVGIESPYDLMSNKFGSYGEMNNAWSGDDVKGFAKIAGNQIMIWKKIKEENKIK